MIRSKGQGWWILIQIVFIPEVSLTEEVCSVGISWGRSAESILIFGRMPQPLSKTTDNRVQAICITCGLLLNKELILFFCKLPRILCESYRMQPFCFNMPSLRSYCPTSAASNHSEASNPSILQVPSFQLKETAFT